MPSPVKHIDAATANVLSYPKWDSRVRTYCSCNKLAELLCYNLDSTFFAAKESCKAGKPRRIESKGKAVRAWNLKLFADGGPVSDRRHLVVGWWIRTKCNYRFSSDMYRRLSVLRIIEGYGELTHPPQGGWNGPPTC